MDERIIYIIIAIVWIVSGLLKAKNKKNAPPKQTDQTETPETAQPEEDFATVLEEMILGKKTEKPKPARTYEEATENVADADTSNSAFEEFEGNIKHNFSGNIEKLEDKQNDYNTSSQKTIQLIADNEEENNEITTVLIDGEPFDPKRAVLYAEILKPKF